MKQINQQKSEMEWEKEMKKRLIEVRNGGFISPILEAIKELLAQSRQQFGEESKERKSCPDCGDIYTCSCFNPNSPKYKTKLT